jgi:Tfp pilus assembly protein PilX
MSKNAITPKRQRGLVLFIALIAIVVMSLAAVGLIRSVDTNAVIANNLSLKQSSLISSDRGVETALNWIEAKVIVNPEDLYTNTAANADDGYYATYLAPSSPDLDNADVLKSDATWAASSADATGPDIVAGTEEASQNNIRYIIQRMCRVDGEPSQGNCLLGEAEIGTSSKGVKSATEAGAIVSSKQSPMYRVTLRVDGPKNTTSYTQTYVY